MAGLWTRIRPWAFLAVPCVGLLEAALHAKQVRSVVPDSDWVRAKERVLSLAKAEDWVVVSPKWTEPVGRSVFGPEVLTLARLAPSDPTLFPRALEVSIRGEHLEALRTWKVVGEEKVGGITLRTYENPAPKKVVDRLLNHARPPELLVSRGQGEKETPCAFGTFAPQTGSLGFGPAWPAERFACAGGNQVAVSIVTDLTYTPRRAFFAPPAPSPDAVRLRFPSVKFGTKIVGYHGIYVEAERVGGSPVTLTLSSDGVLVGRVVHVAMQGWARFEFSTREFSGGSRELTLEVTSQNPNRRLYGVDAWTEE